MNRWQHLREPLLENSYGLFHTFLVEEVALAFKFVQVHVLVYCHSIFREFDGDDEVFASLPYFVSSLTSIKA